MPLRSSEKFRIVIVYGRPAKQAGGNFRTRALYCQLSSVFAVPIRVRNTPFPRAAHDAFKVGVFWPPAQFLLDSLRTCDQHSGITGPTWRLLGRNGMARDFAHGLNHFANAEAAAVAE